jgi:hypothetical protein
MHGVASISTEAGLMEKPERSELRALQPGRPWFIVEPAVPLILLMPGTTP